jgi:hypothetical protein
VLNFVRKTEVKRVRGGRRGGLYGVGNSLQRVSQCVRKLAVEAYPRPYLIAACSSTVISRRPSTCGEPRFSLVDSKIIRLKRGAIWRLDVMVLAIRGWDVVYGVCRCRKMPICWQAVGMRSWRALKTHLPPGEVGESTRRADPVSNAFGVVEIPTGSPYAVLQAVVVHLQGVEGVGRRDVGCVGLPDRRHAPWRPLFRMIGDILGRIRSEYQMPILPRINLYNK